VGFLRGGQLLRYRGARILMELSEGRERSNKLGERVATLGRYL
jgi:hypothetical protein